MFPCANENTIVCCYRLASEILFFFWGPSSLFKNHAQSLNEKMTLIIKFIVQLYH